MPVEPNVKAARQASDDIYASASSANREQKKKHERED
jgi:hypothetical protein